jgi:hypothetical protein
MKRGFMGSVSGGTSFVVAVCLSLLISTAAIAQPVPSKMIVLAGGGLYTTDIGVTAPRAATTSTNLTLSQCQGTPISVGPGGSRYFEDATRTIFCGGQPDYSLVAAPASDAVILASIDKWAADAKAQAETELAGEQHKSFREAYIALVEEQRVAKHALAEWSVYSMLHFSDGKTESSYKVPALGAAVPGQETTIGLDEALTNSDRQQLRALCGFPGSEGTIEVTFYGPDGEKLNEIPERVSCQAPITLQTFKTQFQSGHAVIRSVKSNFGVPNCSFCAAANVYGALVNSTSTNGNARVLPF